MTEHASDVPPRVFSYVDAAAYANTSTKVISKAVNDGALPAHLYFGRGRPKIHQDELDEWILAQPRYVPGRALRGKKGA